MIRSLPAVAFLALACTTVVADELPIARVFAAPALNGPVPRGVQISADGAWVTYLKPEPADQTTFDLSGPAGEGRERKAAGGRRQSRAA